MLNGIRCADLEVDLKVAFEVDLLDERGDLVCILSGLDDVIYEIGNSDFTADILGEECCC